MNVPLTWVEFSWVELCRYKHPSRRHFAGRKFQDPFCQLNVVMFWPLTNNRVGNVLVSMKFSIGLSCFQNVASSLSVSAAACSITTSYVMSAPRPASPRPEIDRTSVYFRSAHQSVLLPVNAVDREAWCSGGVTLSSVARWAVHRCRRATSSSHIQQWFTQTDSRIGLNMTNCAFRIFKWRGGGTRVETP